MKKTEIYNMIPIGVKKAVTLEHICVATGASERKIRKIFEQLTEDERPVCNIGTGYFRPETVQELDAYCKYINSYRCKLLKKLYRLERAKRHFGISPIVDKGNVPKKGKKAL